MFKDVAIILNLLSLMDCGERNLLRSPLGVALATPYILFYFISKLSKEDYHILTNKKATAFLSAVAILQMFQELTH